MYCELLPSNQNVNFDKYCLKLDQPGSIIDDRNVWNWRITKVSFITTTRDHMRLREKLLQFDWNVLSHPPYSADVAPSDHLSLPFALEHFETIIPESQFLEIVGEKIVSINSSTKDRHGYTLTEQ